MGMIIGLVFIGIFTIVALPLIAAGSGSAHQAKRIHDTLDTALATESPELRDQIVNLRKSDQLSAIPWLHRSLLKFELAPRLRTLLLQADLNWNAGSLLAGSGLCFAVPAYLLYLRYDSLLIPVLVGLLLGFAPFLWVLHKRNKRLATFQEALPEALDLMVSALRAGHSLIAAMGMAARECADPIGIEFKTCFEEQNYGLELKTALDNLTHRVPLQELRIVCTAIMIQKESGGNLAEVLDKTSYIIRESFRLKREIATRSAQGRLTGWILTFLPVALGIAMYIVNADMMSVLWKTAIGIKLLYAAGAMIVVGGLIVRQIIKGIDV
jgi:tight adherence protein B